jgi:hypothetical protein
MSWLLDMFRVVTAILFVGSPVAVYATKAMGAMGATHIAFRIWLYDMCALCAFLACQHIVRAYRARSRPTPEEVAALLERFAVTTSPTITDREEKRAAFQRLIAAGNDCVPSIIEACRISIQKGAPMTFYLKLLRELLNDVEYRDTLVKLLRCFHTGYVRTVGPKVQVLQALEEVISPEVPEAVAPFLEDVNEEVRFHAVQTTLAQREPSSIPALVRLLQTEESLRVRNKVAEGPRGAGWGTPAPRGPHPP